MFDLIKGRDTNPLNSLLVFILSAIAVIVLSFHHLFDEWNPLLMILIQYIIAIALMMLVVYIGTLFEPMDEGGYREVFVSFSITYAIGAVIYYIEVFRSAYKQNQLLQEIKKEAEKENTKK